MKKIILTLSFAISLFFVGNTQETCNEGRYDEEVFTDLEVTSDIKYGNNDRFNGDNIDLLLDVYQPLGDTKNDRPLIIFMHGGTFIAGNKTNDDVKPLAENFAKKGYVTSSINYRIGMANTLSFSGPSDGDAAEAVFRATQDARAAVRFFKKSVAEEGNPYGIDPDEIYLVGASAGGFMALHLAYLTNDEDIPEIIDQTQPGLAGGVEGESGNPGYPADVKGIVNLAGALGDVEWMKADATPVLSLHGSSDNTVPFDTDWISVLVFDDIIKVDGSESIHKKAEELGIKHCFKPFWGAGHVPHVGNQNYRDTTELYIREFLLTFVCDTEVECPCETDEDPSSCYNYGALSTNDVITSSDFTIYPNPVIDELTIDYNGTISSIVVYDTQGKVVMQEEKQSTYSTSLNTNRLEKGVYFLKIQTDKGVGTAKFIKE